MTAPAASSELNASTETGDFKSLKLRLYRTHRGDVGFHPDGFLSMKD